MATTSYHVVPAEESEIHDEPHLEGRRITVRLLKALIEDDGLDPKQVADRYDLDLVDVYHGLAYYHAHPEEMARVERERREAIEAEREDALTGPDDLP